MQMALEIEGILKYVYTRELCRELMVEQKKHIYLYMYIYLCVCGVSSTEGLLEQLSTGCRVLASPA